MIRRSVNPGRFATFATLQGLMLLLVLAACESPEPPAPCGTLAGHVLTVGQTANATACFEDPNLADTLTYAVASSDPSVATATIAGKVVTVTAVVPGIATITITATDPEGLQGHQRFTVSVPNRPPAAQGSIEAATIPVGGTATIDASAYFTEPDGQALTYSAASSESRVASVTVNQQIIIVSSLVPGSTTITVTATDPGGLSATQSFMVTVPNRGPEARGEIPAVTLEAGNTITLDVSAYFTDPDDDPLTYAATSSEPAVATVTAVHEAVIISSLSRGASDVTVTVTDPGGLTATQSFTVTVPNRSPEPRGTFPGVSLHVGDTLTLDLSTFFTDPDGDTLAYEATASVAAITTSADADGVVTIAAVARGSGAVTVTATDPAGLSAMQSFRVDIPNRPPRTGPRLPTIEVNVGYPAELNAAPYFHDPDGDDLTYSATTSDAGVATVSVSGATITVTPVAQGSATLTVTASDPEDLTVSQNAPVTVRPRDPGYFADAFDSNASVNNWRVSGGRARVRNGVLSLTNTRGNRNAVASRDHAVGEWSVTATLGRDHANVSAALVMFMDHDRYTHYILQIGSGVEVDGRDTNFRFLLYDAEDDTYSHPPGLQGSSALIDDDTGDLTGITFSLVNRVLVLRTGTTELFRSFPLNQTLPVETTGYAMVAWPHDSSTGRTVLFDWYEMDGTLVGGGAQAGRAGGGGQLRRLPHALPGEIRTGEVPGLRRAPPGG